MKWQPGQGQRAQRGPSTGHGGVGAGRPGCPGLSPGVTAPLTRPLVCPVSLACLHAGLRVPSPQEPSSRVCVRVQVCTYTGLGLGVLCAAPAPPAGCTGRGLSGCGVPGQGGPRSGEAAGRACARQAPQCRLHVLGQPSSWVGLGKPNLPLEKTGFAPPTPPPRAEVHMKGMNSLSPEACIFPYIEH